MSVDVESVETEYWTVWDREQSDLVISTLIDRLVHEEDITKCVEYVKKC